MKQFRLGACRDGHPQSALDTPKNAQLLAPVNDSMQFLKEFHNNAII